MKPVFRFTALMSILLFAGSAMAQTTQSLSEAKAAVIDTKKTLDDSMLAAQERMKSDPGVVAAKVEFDKADRERAAARAGSDPQAKLDASSKWTVKNQQLQEARDAYLNQDKDYLAALTAYNIAAKEAAQLDLESAKAKLAGAQAASVAESDRKVKEYDANTPEVSASTLSAAVEKYEKHRVKMMGVGFVEAGNESVKELPFVKARDAAKDFTFVQVDPSDIGGAGMMTDEEMKQYTGDDPSLWMSVVVHNRGVEFGGLFANKKKFLDDVLHLKQGQSVNFYGTVVKLRNGEPGIVIDKIETSGLGN